MAKGEGHNTVKAMRLEPSGAKQVDWCAPMETPIGMVYNNSPHAVMMATPLDLRDFALGFALSEGIINRADECMHVDIKTLKKGMELHMEIPPRRKERLAMHGQNRAHFGRTGCGICGVDRLDDAIRPLPVLPPTDLRIAYAAADIAAQMLTDLQPLRKVNKSVHGAAWVKTDGTVRLVREDIGRHNALDKLIGACAAEGVDFADGFALLSSRCTYELVQKCALAGIGALLTLSAPSASALDTAKRANVALASWDGHRSGHKKGALVVFNGTVWTA